MTLDSTYQVLGLDPWYTTTVVTARRAFAQACRLSVACAAATAGGGGAWARIGALAARLARAPVTGQTTLADGTRGTAHRDRADPGQPGEQRRLRPGRLP